VRTNPISFRDDYKKINLDDFYVNYLLPFMKNYVGRDGNNVIDSNLKIFLEEMPDNIDNCLGIFHNNKNENENIETVDIYFDLLYRDIEGRNNNRNLIEFTFSKICDIFNNKSSFDLISNVSDEDFFRIVFTRTILPVTATEDASSVPRKDLRERILFLSSFQMRITNC
jgi:hypothetical protein